MASEFPDRVPGASRVLAIAPSRATREGRLGIGEGIAPDTARYLAAVQQRDLNYGEQHGNPETGPSCIA